MRLIILSVAICFLLACNLALSCPEISLNKQSFLPGETVQLEIDGNSELTKSIDSSDISITRIKDNARLITDITIVKISNQKFFAFFDLPSLNIDLSEEYSIKVVGYCNNKMKISSKTFTIKKAFAEFYRDFEGQIKDRWSSFSTEEYASCLMASRYNPSLYEQGRLLFGSRNCPTQCNTVENSIALIALEWPQFVEWLNSSKIINGEIECWGNNTCNAKDTAYALLALKKLNIENEKAVTWLEINANSDEEKAIAVYLTGQDYLNLISRQSTNGYWFKNNMADVKSTALAVYALKSIENNVNGSSKNLIINSINKGEQWLLQRFDTMNREEKAFTLFFVFPKENIESIIAVWPGVVKTETPRTVSMIIKNKGKNTANVLVEVLDNHITFSLPENTIKNIQVDIPLMTTPDKRALFSNIKFYYDNEYGYSSNFNVPLIIFTSQGEMNINGSAGMNESIILPEEEEKIKKNVTQSNETTEQGQNLIKTPIKFIESEIKQNITGLNPVTVNITLENKLDKEVKNILIRPSLSLMSIINVYPSLINLDAHEKKTIVVTINPTKTDYYAGTINAVARIDNDEYTSAVNFYIDIKISGSANQIFDKTCKELGGRECTNGEICKVAVQQAKDTNLCCIPESNCIRPKNKTSIIGIIIFGVVLVVLIAILFLLSRKKQKQMSEILEEAKQKYESKFQRGFPR